MNTFSALPAAGDQRLLHVEGLSIGLQQGDTLLPALCGITFTLAAGETIGLVGESGAGKSLLLKALVNQMPAGFHITQGAVHYFSDEEKMRLFPVPVPVPGRDVTFIPQDPLNALNPAHTVGQHFQEQLLRLGISKLSAHARAIAMLQAVNLSSAEQLLQCYPHQLSGGMAQRVLIALAFVTQPRLVICDEVTTALDAANQTHVVRLISQMQRQFGTSVLLVTHDLLFAAQHCHRLLVMYAGEIIEQGDASQLITHPAHPYTRMLLQARPTLIPIWRRLPDIPGHMPTLSELPDASSCRFSPRCSHSRAVCLVQKPAAIAYDDRHTVLCHFPEAACALEPKNDSETVTQSIMPMLSGTAQPFLRVERLTKHYSTRVRFRRVVTPALSDISFTVAAGEFIGVIGESGSGKSTLARLVMGIDNITDGQMWLNGALVKNSGQCRQSVQMIFQNNYHALNPKRNVANLLTQSMDHHSHFHRERQLRAQELAGIVGLPLHLLEQYPSQLSGGQRQRVNIGRALCTMPQLLVADEIVSGLDVSVQARILNLLLDLRQQHKFALLLISHDLGVVNYLCSKVIVLQGGRIVEQGPTQGVFSNPHSLYAQRLLSHSRPSGAEK